MFSQRLSIAFGGWACALAATASWGAEADSPAPVTAAEARAAAIRALPLLERGAAGSASQRLCFTCHSQAMPVLAFAEALRRGLHVDAGNLERQLAHTHRFLGEGKQRYEEGRGQGGGVDTAGYALWTLEAGGRPADAVTRAVTQWLLKEQTPKGHWIHKSNRPPSEASDFTTTYLAMRALRTMAAEDQAADVESALRRAGEWMRSSEPRDNEDRVFRLLGLSYAEAPSEAVEAATAALAAGQRPDGGWAQLDTMESDAYGTATALYALRQAGDRPATDAGYQRGLRFLLDNQQPDGSWRVVSRSKPFQTYFETGFPHGEHQFISTTATAWATMALLSILPEASPAPIEALAGTDPLDWPEEDLSQRMMLDAHRLIERQIEASHQARDEAWEEAGAEATARAALKTILGIVERREAPRIEQFGDDENPAVVAETDRFQALQVRWPVFENVQGEGLWVRPKGERAGLCVVVPDADQTPEQALGLGEPGGPGEHSPIGRTLAERGFELLIPAIVSREPLQTDDPRLQRADYTEREWIYRQAFHMGRHVLGYDIQRILAAVDCLKARAPDGKIGLTGYGEGGLIALYAAAVDSRVDAALVSGCFDSSDKTWTHPIYRNVWSRLKLLGNAEVARLVLPRTLVIEHSPFPAVEGHKGAVATPPWRDVEREFGRIAGPDAARPAELIAGPENATTGPGSREALVAFGKGLGAAELAAAKGEPLQDRRTAAAEWVAQRKERTMRQLETHVQGLVRKSEHVRDEFFLYQAAPELKDTRWSTQRRHPSGSPDAFVAASKPFRERFVSEAMGRLHEPRLAPRPRTRKVAESAHWTAYDVALDVHQDLFAWGVLVVPKGIKPGERRPVVVCQHGRNGVPRDTLDRDQPAYNNFAGKLAERGFVTFAPHNLYRGEDQYRWLDRKANAIGCTLFSFIIAQHEQILDWLETVPFVDGERIAFYGLSYGGETAVRVPTILEKYRLSICSGDFNQWTRKVAATDQPFSFMNTIEWEMPYWNLGQTFDYAEMAYLMAPRPFMVERGHHDRVGRDHWVAHEFAKVRWLYAQLGIADRVEIEFFQGGHSIHGEKTFEFLHKHLDWPAPPRP